MPMFKDSYSTSMGSMYNVKPVVSGIQEAIIRDNINTMSLGVLENNGIKPVFITGSFDSEDKIPLFTHPISIFNFNGNSYLCTDMRLFIRKGVAHDDYYDVEKRIRNTTEFDFAKSRAVLNLVWIAEGVGSVKNDLLFCEVVYAAWLSQVISRAFALDFKDQTIVNIMASLFYQSLFYDIDSSSEEDKHKLTVHTMETTKAPEDLVSQVVNKVKPFKDIHDWCQQLNQVLENVRFTKFNAAVLLNSISSSWYGQGAKEILAVSLEHPPTWCAMVYTALKQRTYKNSMVYQVAERMGKRGAADQFLNSFNMLVRQHVTLESLGYPEIPDFE